ncbi:hypothetical protein PoB_004293600 [Plakobranchus ocellatus]|uniref:Uncharacterized protein n=1 Tax=Plakobranchus ocellatus TaxID=259542 RepID=A0AAV4B7L0_9GAST|nr:hypothetical protein PoB_004293600 [Plakobranchus ocellatus]
MVTQVFSSVQDYKQERANQYEPQTMPSRQELSDPSDGHVKTKRTVITPTSSHNGSAHGRRKSGSSRGTSRPNSKSSHRPTTAASTGSCVLPGGSHGSQDDIAYLLDEATEDLLFSEEGRLSRCLKSWMPDYELRSLPPQPNPPKEAVFSARLGEHMRIIRRSNSSESVTTQLSLFSCSSHGSNAAAAAAAAAKQRRRRRRRMREEQENGGGEDPKKSIWVELASRTGGALDKMLRMHAMYAQLDTETAIFQKLPDHEKKLVTEAGTKRGIHLGPDRQRSDSESNIFKKLPLAKTITLAEEVESKRRLQSAGSKIRGPITNFQELRRQMVNQRLASLQEKFNRHRQSSRRSLTGTKSISRLSPSSTSSNNDVFQINTPLEASASLQDLEYNKDFTDDKNKNVNEGQVSVWKGDSQILAIDLQRELTAKVKSKIATTTSALERATGYGDDNSPQNFIGPLEEYPNLVDQDYSQVARIPQRIRISPHLSDVIRTDINVRMGRPRYHEIRMRDLDLWNRGTDLDRSHCNLKVFNWLHSLRETEFDMSLPEGVEDAPPGGDVTTRDEVVVAVDEPEIKPLFERLKKERYIV